MYIIYIMVKNFDDGYVYYECYILGMGLLSKDKINLDGLIYGDGRATETCIKMLNLVLSFFCFKRNVSPSS